MQVITLKLLVFFYADEEASWLLLPSSVFLLSATKYNQMEFLQNS